MFHLAWHGLWQGSNMAATLYKTRLHTRPEHAISSFVSIEAVLLAHAGPDGMCRVNRVATR